MFTKVQISVASATRMVRISHTMTTIRCTFPKIAATFNEENY